MLIDNLIPVALKSTTAKTLPSADEREYVGENRTGAIKAERQIGIEQQNHTINRRKCGCKS